MDSSPLAGGTALVTGAAKRIGRQIALACAAEGMNVVVHYHRSKTDAQRLCRELEAMQVNAWAVYGALENSRGCDALIDTAFSLSGKTFSLLVNNASMFPKHSLYDISFGDIVAAVRVNTWVPLCLSRAFAKKVRRGSIVNLLDSRIEGHDRSHVAYMLSKHMLAAFTKICALEFAPKIRVNGVAPGLILPPAGETDSYLDRLKKHVPLKTRGAPQDIAAAVVFLAKSTFVTGETIFVDGGKHLLESYNAP
jgi:pteridine reductase